MKLSTVWSAYQKATDKYEVADKNYLESPERLRSYYGRVASRCLKRRLRFSAYLNRKIEALERPATQCCPQCEAKQRQIDGLKARIDSMVEQAVQASTKITDLQDTISKQRYVERARGVLRIAELEADVKRLTKERDDAVSTVAGMRHYLHIPDNCDSPVNYCKHLDDKFDEMSSELSRLKDLHEAHHE